LSRKDFLLLLAPTMPMAETSIAANNGSWLFGGKTLGSTYHDLGAFRRRLRLVTGARPVLPVFR